MMRRGKATLVRVLVLVVAAAMLAAACGSDGADDEATDAQLEQPTATAGGEA